MSIFFNKSKVGLQEFDNNVKKLATVLHSKGLQAGDVIAILLREKRLKNRINGWTSGIQAKSL